MTHRAGIDGDRLAVEEGISLSAGFIKYNDKDLRWIGPKVRMNNHFLLFL